jgi:hypothetical protein
LYVNGGVLYSVFFIKKEREREKREKKETKEHVHKDTKSMVLMYITYTKVVDCLSMRVYKRWFCTMMYNDVQ